MAKLTDAQLVILTAAAQREGGDANKGSASKKRQPAKRRGGTGRKPVAAKSKNGHPPPAVRQGTKQALLIDLLKRKKGATIDDAVKATGWQPHSVRGAISGALKKKLGDWDSAALVRGVDNFGNFHPTPPVPADFDADAVAFHKRATQAVHDILYQGAEHDTARL